MSSTTELPSNFKKAFKDADIRGVYPTEINEVVAYRVARAFVEEFSLKKIIVARDMRVSSPSLRNAFVAGARDSGADVLDIGMVDTPGLYYASGTYKLYGVMITASHNPMEYNGLKLVKSGAVPLTNKTGLLSIKKRIVANDFKKVTLRGSVKKKTILKEYAGYIRGKTKFTAARPLRIVADAGNGMASLLAPILCKGLPIEITPLFFTLDGTFPNRESNPTLAKNQKAIKKELKKGGYDFGVAFDGDVDRVAFFDEKGNYINSAVIGALLAKHLIRRYPKSAHVYTVFTSKVYEETIKEAGGKAVRARVGHAFIKEQMRKKEAVFGCEHSAHFYFKDNFYADSGVLAFLYLAATYAEAEKERKSFSQMLKPFARYYQTEEVLVKVKDKKITLDAITAQYTKQKPLSIENYDGVTIRFADYWFVIKESVTEDALKFVVESPQKKIAITKQKEILQYLRKY